jgi:hypothetical protein
MRHHNSIETARRQRSLESRNAHQAGRLIDVQKDRSSTDRL